MSKQTGSNYERDLEEQLREHDYSTLRAPGSGGGGPADRPDVIALREWEGVIDAWALELKSVSELPVYLSEAEIDALKRWSNRAGATPLVGVSPDKRLSEYDMDRYYTLDSLDRTESGNYVVRDTTPYAVLNTVFE